jgi:hypothetical protein
VLVRNAHLIAVSDCFFAFQQKVEQFFRLLEGVPRAPELEREEVHPVLKAMLVHAPVEPDEVLRTGGKGCLPVRKFGLIPQKLKRARKSPTPCTRVIKIKEEHQCEWYFK